MCVNLLSTYRAFILQCSVVRRVVRLHQNLATALASSEAAVKQAKGVSDHCEDLMEEIEELKVHLWISNKC